MAAQRGKIVSLNSGLNSVLLSLPRLTFLLATISLLGTISVQANSSAAALFVDIANDSEILLGNVNSPPGGRCMSGTSAISDLHLFGHGNGRGCANHLL